MKIPFFILKAKEDTASFRRRVDLLRSNFSDWRSREAFKELHQLIAEYDTLDAAQSNSSKVPLTKLFDRALLWANSPVPPPVDALREARAALEQISSDWGDAWTDLGSLVKPWIDSEGVRFWDRFSYRDEPLVNIVTLALAEQTRARGTLEESWPVRLEHDEQEALKEMKAGQFVELDEAFASIAGVSKEAWAARAEQHKRNRLAGRTDG